MCTLTKCIMTIYSVGQKSRPHCFAHIFKTLSLLCTIFAHFRIILFRTHLSTSFLSIVLNKQFLNIYCTYSPGRFEANNVTPFSWPTGCVMDSIFCSLRIYTVRYDNNISTNNTNNNKLVLMPFLWGNMGEPVHQINQLAQGGTGHPPSSHSVLILPEDNSIETAH